MPAPARLFALEVELFSPSTQRALEGAALELTMDVAPAEDGAGCTITELDSSDGEDDTSEYRLYPSGRGRRLRELGSGGGPEYFGRGRRLGQPGYGDGPEYFGRGTRLRQPGRPDAL